MCSGMGMEACVLASVVTGFIHKVTCTDGEGHSMFYVDRFKFCLRVEAQARL